MVLRQAISGQFAKYRKLLGKPPDQTTASPSTPLTNPETPTVWCHVETPTQARAITSVCHRILDEWGPIQLRFTCAEGCVHWTPDTRDAFLLKAPTALLLDNKISSEFLTECAPTIAIWAGFIRSPSGSRWLNDRNIPQIVLDGVPPPIPKGFLNRTFAPKPTLPEKGFTVFPMSERAIQYYANTQNVDLKSAFMGRLQPGLIPQSCNETDRETLSEATLSRQIWFAVHCSADEVQIVLAAHRMALRTAHRLLLIIAAPNPEAGNALRKEAEALGFLTAQRSVEKTPGDECQIFIADTDEGLGLWYRLSPISFLGQSVKRGLRGVDPCEAAALGSAILHGPWIGDHRHIYDKLDKADAARVVHHQEGLAKMVGQLMAPDVVAEMAQAAWMIATEGAELSDALLDTMMDALDQSGTE